MTLTLEERIKRLQHYSMMRGYIPSAAVLREIAACHASGMTVERQSVSLRDACNAVCDMCREGVPIDPEHGRFLVSTDVYHEPYPKQYVLCEASAVRNLVPATEPYGTQRCPICEVSDPHRHDSDTEVFECLERLALRTGRKVKVYSAPDEKENFGEFGLRVAHWLGSVRSLHSAASIIQNAFEEELKKRGQEGKCKAPTRHKIVIFLFAIAFSVRQRRSPDAS